MDHLHDWLCVPPCCMRLASDLENAILQVLTARRRFHHHWSAHAFAFVARNAAAGLETHLSTWVMRWLPFLANESHSGLVELAECIRQKQSCITSAHGHPPEEEREGEGLAASRDCRAWGQAA